MATDSPYTTTTQWTTEGEPSNSIFDGSVEAKEISNNVPGSEMKDALPGENFYLLRDKRFLFLSFCTQRRRKQSRARGAAALEKGTLFSKKQAMKRALCKQESNDAKIYEAAFLLNPDFFNNIS